MKKTAKIVVTVLCCVICIAIMIIGGFNIYQRISYAGFYKNANTHGKVPGIADGFIQQGLSYIPNEKKFISCGYMKDGGASRIYIFDEDSEDYVALKNVDGSANDCHAGGLSYWNNCVIMCDRKDISFYNAMDIIAGGGEAVEPFASIDIDYNPAFCYISGDALYVGEFYREQNYKTDESHHMTTPAGDYHHALITVYDLNEILKYGFTSAVPVKAYSIVDLAQGMCITDSGRICISTSYAFAPSHIYVYDMPSDGDNSEIKIGDVSVPLYYLDSAVLKEDIVFFPMSEELVNVDGRVYIMNESASAKYFFGRLTGGGKIYSVEIE